MVWTFEQSDTHISRKQELQEKSGCCPRKTTNSRQQTSQQAEVRTGKHSKSCITWEQKESRNVDEILGSLLLLSKTSTQW
jgi:hypothetical protein